MIPLVVIRPQPGTDRTVAAARELGLDARAFPLLEIRPRAWEPPDPAAIDALLIGSANAVGHAGPNLGYFRDKPVHAVGEATAEACRGAGLQVAAIGGGGLQNVLDGVPPGTRLLRLAGEERMPLTPPAEVEMIERTVYANELVPLPSDLADLLRDPSVVALHSAAAARHFAAECDRLRIVRGKLSLVAIGPRVAAAAGSGWADIATARTPDDEALLARAAQLCQNAAQGA
jgi:uroporphyrinogen-III synthase